MPLSHYRIDLNAVLKSFVNLPQEPLAVTWESPLKLRQEVERFAIYFRREFNYDFQQFVATEKPKPREKPMPSMRLTKSSGTKCGGTVIRIGCTGSRPEKSL